MRILATGGAGYVGSTVVRTLLQRGHEVYAYDNLCKGFKESVPAGRLIIGDINDYHKLCTVFKEKQIEAVMHFASYIAVGESCEKPREYYDNNIAASLNLLDAMMDSGVKKMLFSSTAAVFAPLGDNDPALTEDSPKAPDSPYAFSKFALERIIDHYSKAYGLGFTILRYFNACGAEHDGRFGEAHDPETHLIPLVLQVPLKQREFIGVFGNDYPTPDGTCIRDYIHVEDLADAHVRAIEAVMPGKADYFNIGTGNGNSVLEVIKAAEEVCGCEIPVKFMPRRSGDTSRLVAGADKLRKQLGWTPKYTDIKKIIETAWNWHKSHPKGY